MATIIRWALNAIGVLPARPVFKLQNGFISTTSALSDREIRLIKSAIETTPRSKV